VNMLQHPDTIDALIESGCELYAYVQSTPHGEQTKYCFNTYGLDYLCLRAFPSVGAQAFELAFHTLDIGIFSFGYIYMVGNELGWHSEEAARNGANSGTNQTLYKTELKDGRVFYSISCFIETEQMLSQIYHYIQRSTNIVVADCSDGLARLPKGTLKDLINIAKGVSYGEISEQMERQGDYCSGEYKLDIGVFGQGR